jgi:hypothetical protein
MKTVYTDIASISFDEITSILYIKIMDDAHMDLERAKEHYSIIRTLTKGEKHSALFDASSYFTSDEEALKYAALPDTTKGRISTAYHSLNLANRLTIHFFRLLYKPHFAIQLFRTSEDAMQWLKQETESSMAS